MKLISKTVVRHYGKSDKWPRYRIVREYYYMDKDNEDNDLTPIDELFWTGNVWSDKIRKAFLYTDLATAVTDKDNIEDLI